MVATPGHGVGRVSARQSRRRCARAVGSARRHRRQTALGRVGIVDRRSIRLNTEVGLIIASGELAAQAERRFESLVDPANSFALALAPTPGGDPHIVWRTVDDGRPESYVHEPLASARRQLAVSFFALLPIEDQL